MLDNTFLVTDWILCGTRRDPVGPWTTEDSQWKDYAPDPSKDCSEPVQRAGIFHSFAQYKLVSWSFKVTVLQKICALFRLCFRLILWTSFLINKSGLHFCRVTLAPLQTQLLWTSLWKRSVETLAFPSFKRIPGLCTHCVNLLKVQWQVLLVKDREWHRGLLHHFWSNFK